jgi:tubulin monoglycylase TTLL3/8
MHNHLTNNFYLGNKKALFYNLKEYYELTGGHLFKVIPLTFHIKKGMRDPQYKRFLVYHKKRHSIIRKQEKDKENGLNIGRPMRNIWIVKPGELTNRGNGITVID